MEGGLGEALSNDFLGVKIKVYLDDNLKKKKKCDYGQPVEINTVEKQTVQDYPVCSWHSAPGCLNAVPVVGPGVPWFTLGGTPPGSSPLRSCAFPRSANLEPWTIVTVRIIGIIRSNSFSKWKSSFIEIK